jgi:hypothetical protein
MRLDPGSAASVLAEDLFAAAGVPLRDTVAWGTQIPERGPGVYVLTLAAAGVPDIAGLPDAEQAHWLKGQHVIYVGRSKRLRRRLREFYRHVYGNPQPHRGGQAVLLLKCPLMVSWGGVGDYAGAEHTMIEAFRASAGDKPFANRVRAARTRRV